MKHALRIMLVVAGCLALSAGAAAVFSVLPQPGPVLTPSQLTATGRIPTMHTGTIVRLRGVLICAGRGNAAVCALLDPPPIANPNMFLVALGAPDPLLATVRSVPLLGQFVPPSADHPVTKRVAVYRVSRRACPSPRALCAGRPGWVLQSGGA